MVTKAQNLPIANFSQINQKNYRPNLLHIRKILQTGKGHQDLGHFLEVAILTTRRMSNFRRTRLWADFDSK